MSYNEKFFSYEPTAIGVVIDASRADVLRAVKNSLMELITSLDDAEDKMVVYGQKHRIELPESLGESVADLFGYREPAHFKLEPALTLVMSVVNETADEFRRFLFYFTDRTTESQARRVDRLLGACASYELDTTFVVFDLGANSKELEEVCGKREVKYLQLTPDELTTDLLKEVIHGKG